MLQALVVQTVLRPKPGTSPCRADSGSGKPAGGQVASAMLTRAVAYKRSALCQNKKALNYQ